MTVSSAEPLLEAVDLVAGYLPEVNVLNRVSLRLGEAEIVGVIGPNGAGKSTLVKAMFGLLLPRDGIVRFAGDDVTGERPHALVARGIGYVPQTDNVFPRLTVAENLQMGVYQRPESWEEQFEFVAELFPLLRERSRQRAGSLSGGERQMLGMGRALMMAPRVLLLDEPSAGLSPILQDEVFDRIAGVNRQGVAVVMVEQNARRCLEICDRAYVLDQGRNAHAGTGKALLHDPKVVELYLGTLAKAR
ncbi:MAG: ABC transporter ATP-binding protein [Actinobacteria bacterium]|nr:ABC transporter ATP-binding protein [Actinomycetota bacterium]